MTVPATIWAAPQAYSVCAFLIDVEVKWHAGFSQGISELETILDGYSSIFAGMPVAAEPKTILEHKARYPVFIKKARITLAFMRRQTAIAAAGTNDHCCAGRLRRVGPERGERGNVFVFLAERAGSAIGPKWKRICGLRMSGGEPSEESEHREIGFHVRLRLLVSRVLETKIEVRRH